MKRKIIGTTMKSLSLFLLFSIIFASNISAQNIFSSVNLNTPERIAGKKAKKINYKFHAYGSWGVSKIKSEISFNQKNQIIYEKRFKNGQLSQVLTFIYNDSSGLLERRDLEQWHSTIGYSKEVNKYEYNTEGHLIGTKTYNKQDQLTSQTKIKINKEGDPIELIIYDSNSKQLGGVEKAEYLYNENLYVRIVYAANGRELSRDTSTLDFHKAHLYPRPDREYDEYGNMTRIDKNDNTFELSEYQYDENGNWVFRKIYKVNKDTSKKEKRILKQKYMRKIEYWE